MFLLNIHKPVRHTKGVEYLKIKKSIEEIKNFSQIEPTRTLIDFFGKKTGDEDLRQELLEMWIEKSKKYQPLYDEFHSRNLQISY